MRFDTVVIGAGPAGILAAAEAAQGGRKVLLLDRNDAPGKKLLITGKGRCNLTNSGSIDEFIPLYGKNGRFLYRAFTDFFNDDLRALFERRGVETKVERGGRVFPVSDDAQVIVAALERYLGERGVTVRGKTRAQRLVVVPSPGGKRTAKVAGVVVEGSAEPIPCVHAVIATGGLSYPGTGSTGDGYRMAIECGHTVVTPRASLVPLEVRERFVKDMQGLGLKNVRVTVYVDGKAAAEEFGEMLFTHFGLSGPVILTLSGDVNDALLAGRTVQISIDLKPALEPQVLTNRLLRELDSSGRKTIANIMKTLLPSSMVPVFLSVAGIPEEKLGNQITKADRTKVQELLIDFRLTVTKARPVAEAIVTRGGVSLDEVDPRTLESKIVEGLYFCGEVLDLDGVTGGYNLQEAFSTGHLAGSSIAAGEKGHAAS